MRENTQVFLIRWAVIAICFGFWFVCYRLAFGHEKPCFYPDGFEVHLICAPTPEFARAELEYWLAEVKKSKGFKVIDIDYQMMRQLLLPNKCCYTIKFVVKGEEGKRHTPPPKPFKFFPED